MKRILIGVMLLAFAGVCVAAPKDDLVTAIAACAPVLMPQGLENDTPALADTYLLARDGEPAIDGESQIVIRRRRRTP